MVETNLWRSLGTYNKFKNLNIQLLDTRKVDLWSVPTIKTVTWVVDCILKGYLIYQSAIIKGTLCTGTPRCRRTTPGRTSTGRCTRRWSGRRWSSARTSRRCWRDTASRNVPFGGSSSHSWVNIETFVQSLLLHNGGFCNDCITKQWLHLEVHYSTVTLWSRFALVPWWRMTAMQSFCKFCS